MIRYNLKLLDWNNIGIKKNRCLANTKRLFWMSNINLGACAADSLIYCDKFDIKNIDIGDILVIGKNNYSIGGASKEYWHIGVIKEVKEECLIMSDWEKAYPNLKISFSNLKKDKWGIITPEKIIKLGATKIKEKDLIPNIIQIMTNYKQLFESKYSKSSIFNDLEWASKNLTNGEQIAYFIAIWFERLKEQIKKEI